MKIKLKTQNKRKRVNLEVLESSRTTPLIIIIYFSAARLAKCQIMDHERNVRILE